MVHSCALTSVDAWSFPRSGLWSRRPWNWNLKGRRSWYFLVTNNEFDGSGTSKDLRLPDLRVGVWRSFGSTGGREVRWEGPETEGRTYGGGTRRGGL